ncbi:hypothetical protein DB32_008668 [Sandaracinus amylolyticus]|uniref:Uncharacterized protein n=1 Tax=Sandaracinus amylolyticus TaxID=927083 RepID=A0A0F6SI38_9BACT|nr:hypothetical protein DB32_008668 [Sandaracinus amylolyticus]
MALGSQCIVLGGHDDARVRDQRALMIVESGGGSASGFGGAGGGHPQSVIAHARSAAHRMTRRRACEIERSRSMRGLLLDH